MLMRTDPFRDLDRLTQQLLGTSARPSAMLMDAWREGDHFVVEFDLPGVNPDSVDLDVERNVLTVTAERPALDENAQFLAAERPAWRVQPATRPGGQPRPGQHPGRVPGRGATAGHPGRRAGQAPQDQHQPQRRATRPSPPATATTAASPATRPRTPWTPTRSTPDPTVNATRPAAPDRPVPAAPPDTRPAGRTPTPPPARGGWAVPLAGTSGRGVGAVRIGQVTVERRWRRPWPTAGRESRSRVMRWMRAVPS